MARDNCPNFLHWENPIIKDGLYNPDKSDHGPNDYIPLADFKPFDFPIPENLAFGTCFLNIIHSRLAPMCQVCRWTHLTGEQINAIFKGRAPAPNIEQIVVASILLQLTTEERNQLCRLATYSWIASGLDPWEQCKPKQSIFVERTPPKETPVSQPSDPAIQSYVKNNAEPAKKRKTSSTIQKRAAVATKTVQHKPAKVELKTQQIEKKPLVFVPPNLRMKVKVDAVIFSDDSMRINKVCAGVDDSIKIDEVSSIDRDMCNVIHYNCRSGRHKIDLFQDGDEWYLDASSLASGF